MSIQIASSGMVGRDRVDRVELAPAASEVGEHGDLTQLGAVAVP